MHLVNVLQTLATRTLLTCALVVSSDPQLLRAAATAPPLGELSHFAILAGETVVNKGPSSVSGDIGVSPGNTVAGFPGGVVQGQLHAGKIAAAAQDSLMTMVRQLDSQPCDRDLTSQPLGGQNFNSGVYCFTGAADLNGTLTFDAVGNPDSIFVVKVQESFAASANAQVVLSNGARACNIYWLIGSSATLGPSSQIKGNITALQSISTLYKTNLEGRLLSRYGSVYLDTSALESCSETVKSPQLPKGRMTGTGTLSSPEGKLDYVFDMRCSGGPNNLEASWTDRRSFRLVTLSTITCINDPAIQPYPPVSGFNVLKGEGTGEYRGLGGFKVKWTFTDSGEPLVDSSEIIVTDPVGNPVISAGGKLESGNNQSFPE